MHKLSTENEGPIDILFLTLTEWITPVLHATGHTPNIITTYSLLCGLAAAVALWNGWLGAFVALFLVAYLFDCVDGYMARRYDQMSVFGDYYDHISDIVKMLAIAGVFLCRYSFVALIPVLLAMAVLGIGSLSYLGCSQRLKKGGDGETLDVFQAMCNHDDRIHWVKYFSTGTFIVGLALAGTYLELTKNKRRRA